MYAWNLPESIGSLDAKCICDLYMYGMVKPSFIPPADIRVLRDLVRYRFKLACMITGEKNRAKNCLTVSNLKLDAVFSDVFDKSSRSITEQILQHPGEKFDVLPFVDCRLQLQNGILSLSYGIKYAEILECHTYNQNAQTYRQYLLRLIECDSPYSLPFRSVSSYHFHVVKWNLSDKASVKLLSVRGFVSFILYPLFLIRLFLFFFRVRVFCYFRVFFIRRFVFIPGFPDFGDACDAYPLVQIDQLHA